jgi:hypothetical protein
MPTFEDLARRAQGLTNLMPPMPLAVQWASDRVHELLGKRRVSMYKRNLELSIPAPIIAGVVAINRGQRFVAGDATAQAAWALLDASFPEGWFIRPRAAWYRVAGRTAQGIELESPYAEASVASVSYTLCRHYHALPLSVYQVDEETFVLSRLGQPLEFLNESDMTTRYPNRWGIYFGGMSLPHSLCEVEPTADERIQLEIYPYPNQSEMVSYAGYVMAPPFTYQSQLPRGIELHHLLPGLMADFYAWAIEDVKDAQVMGVLLNEKARCLTRFEAAKEQALQHVESNRIRGFVLAHRGRRDWSPGGIRDAYSEVWSRP